MMRGYPYRVECCSELLGTWHFVCNSRDLTSAVESAAHFRELLKEPARVVRQ